MRNFAAETEKRMDFIRECLRNSSASGIVFGNSGGKDSALVGVLCKLACENTVGIIMPCQTKRNYETDMTDARQLAELFKIETRIVDLTSLKLLAVQSLGEVTDLNDTAIINIAPRLRMMTLYAVAAAENRLVAGTGNRSEIYMGYFTKWGDGAYDFNPIADLTVSEIYEYLRYFKVPESIIEKAPSGGLLEGQTDEGDMGVSYAAIDNYLLSGQASEHDRRIIESFHNRSGHKRRPPAVFGG